MKTNIKTNLHDQLLQARERGLKNLQEEGLKPHGKLLGMDVFSWQNPDVYLLINTMHSFPFPVIWIAQSVDWDRVISEDKSILDQLEVTIIYDGPSDERYSVHSKEPFKIVKKSSLQNALEYLNRLNAFKSVLLFTSSGADRMDRLEEFNEYLTMHQIRR